MASTGLFGPNPLTDNGIDGGAPGVGAGAYALGRVDNGGAFLVSYVGRSDDDLNGRLKDHIGRYTHFKHAFFPTAKAAFEKECHLYHDFNPPGNAVHPAKPQGTSFSCPICGS